MRGAGYGLAAAAAFGGFLLALGEAADGGGPAAVLCGRLASVPVLAPCCCCAPRGTAEAGAALARARPPCAPDARVLGGLGALDVLANLAYAGAAAGGGTAAVAVLASLYPLTTVLLARALLDERIGRARAAGVGAVLGGVALISLSAG